MPTFTTPHPITAVVDISGVQLTVRAGDHPETTVDLRPHHPGRAGDVDLAQRTTVELADGRLHVRLPRNARSRLRSLIGGGARVDLDIVLPAGSSLDFRGAGDLTVVGRLDRVDIDTGMGDIDLDIVGGRLRARTSLGDIRVGSSSGPVELRTSAGTVEVGRAGGDVTASTSAGDVRVDESEGEVRVSTSAGDIRVERAATTVSAKTSAGDIRLHSVCSGTISAETTYGRVEIGVAEGTAVWLDVEARHGVVRSDLAGAEGPGDAHHTAEIRATTGYGDILLRRA